MISDFIEDLQRGFDQRIKKGLGPYKQRLISQYKKGVKKSPGECRINKLLQSIRVRALWQKGFGINFDSFVFVDFYFPKPLRVCLEIDGESHDDEKQKLKDRERDNYLCIIRGFRVRRISEHAALTMKANELKKMIDNWA